MPPLSIHTINLDGPRGAEELNMVFYFCYIVKCLPNLGTGNGGSQTQDGVSICLLCSYVPICLDAHTLGRG